MLFRKKITRIIRKLPGKRIIYRSDIVTMCNYFATLYADIGVIEFMGLKISYDAVEWPNFVNNRSLKDLCHQHMRGMVAWIVLSKEISKIASFLKRDKDDELSKLYDSLNMDKTILLLDKIQKLVKRQRATNTHTIHSIVLSRIKTLNCTEEKYEDQLIYQIMYNLRIGMLARGIKHFDFPEHDLTRYLQWPDFNMGDYHLENLCYKYLIALIYRTLAGLPARGISPWGGQRYEYIDYYLNTRRQIQNLMERRNKEITK